MSRDRILHYAESVAFGVLWIYLLPVAFIGWWLFGSDDNQKEWVCNEQP